MRVARERVGSTCSRAASIIRPNGTWEGQTSSHARHTRHRSMNAANDPSTSAPSVTARIAAIRPRGDADSSPVRRYVGQCGKHRPHATHAERSSAVGASRPGRHPAPVDLLGCTNRAPCGSSVPRGSGSVATQRMLRRIVGEPVPRGRTASPIDGERAGWTSCHRHPAGHGACRPPPRLGRHPRAARRRPRRAPPPVWPIILIVFGALILVLGGIGAVVASTGGSSSASPSAAALSPSVAPPGAPTHLHAAAPAFQVKLTWHTATDGTAASRFDVRRNGNYVGQANGSATSFTDKDPVPGEHYRYTVTAVGADEQRTAASVSVATKTAPPGTAALTGTFNVHLHNTSHSGFSSFGSANVNNGWRLLPQCNEPPCNTQLRNINTKKMTVLLKQNGGSYSGSASVPGLVTWQGHDVTASVTVTIHATRADAVHDSWQVTKFSGTMSQYASAQLGCTSSSASFTVTGTSLKG